MTYRLRKESHRNLFVIPMGVGIVAELKAFPVSKPQLADYFDKSNIIYRVMVQGSLIYTIHIVNGTPQILGY